MISLFIFMKKNYNNLIKIKSKLDLKINTTNIIKKINITINFY